MNPATADLFRDEIARLQAEIARLRSQPCPYVTGNVTKHCTLTPFSLTDAEREAINVAQNLMAGTAHAKALGSLLERLSPRS
jgi:hypothetical protein